MRLPKCSRKKVQTPKKINGSISLRHFILNSANASKVLPRIFDAVSEALYSEKKLRIEYTNMNGKTTSAVISPLALVQQDVRLYLICQFDHFDNVVHLALHRFKNG